jgi:hypothetical protein
MLVVLNELQRRPLRLTSLIRDGTLFSMPCLLVIGPWYLRSFIATGNPIWPFAYHIFGGRNWDALGAEYLVNAQMDLLSPDLPRNVAGLIQATRYMLLQPEILGTYPGGIGSILPLGGCCAMLLLKPGPRILRQILAICGGFYILWFILLPLQLRYLLPIVPLLALATAFFYIWLYDRVKIRIGQFAMVAMLLLLVLRTVPWILANERSLFVSHLPVITGQVSRLDWLAMRHKGFDLFNYANTHLPPDARILLLPHENRTYYLDRDYVWGCPTCQRIIPFERFTSPTELAAALQQMGITHVIDNPVVQYDHLRYWKHSRALMLALRDTCGQTLYQQGESVLYELTACPP